MKKRPFILQINVALLMVTLLLCGVNKGIQGYENFHHHMKSENLDYDSLFKEAVTISDVNSGQKILARCLDAYGGVEQLRELRSLKMIWQMKAIMSTDSVEVTKSAIFDRKYRIYRRHTSGFETRIINGDLGWYQTADTMIHLFDGRYKAELYSYLVMAMPLALKTEAFSDIRYGKRKEDSLHYIYARKSDSLIIIIGIAPDNYLIKRAEGVIYQGSEKFVFVNEFDDYRKVDGYMVPHKMVNVSMGLTVGQSILKEAVINCGFSETEFEPIPLHKYD